MVDDFEDDLLNKSEEKHKGTWKKIFKTVLIHPKSFILMIVFVILLGVMDVLYPLMNGYAIDVFFKEGDFTNMGPFIIGYIVIAVGYLIAITGFLFFAGKVEIQTSYELRNQAYEKLQNLSFSYFDRTPQGWIMARMSSDARKLSGIISWGIVDLLWGISLMVGIIIVLFCLNARLALIVICVLPILLLVSFWLRKKILKSYREARKVNSRITAKYNESFMGIKATKTLVIEDKINREFNDEAAKLRKASIRAVIYSSLFGPVIFFIGYVGLSLTLYEGTGMYLLGIGLTLGTLYMFIDYTVRFFEPVLNIARIISDFQNAQASAERIIQLIEATPDIIDTPEVIEKYGTTMEPKKENWEDIKGDVEFRNVTFKYNKGQTVLEKFNLNIKAGTTVALVGHTGAGKSTIVNLMCRFYEPTEGEVLIDGKNYKERSISWLHSHFGYVLQTPQLFSGTIKENIRYGRRDATDEEVIAAAKLANADEFISRLDDGYNSSVGEGASRLSLGEKQLISFARAILANPRILVLDEATSSIDTESEYKIQEAIGALLKGRTSFVVAHRLSTIINSDIILVLEQGKVIEQGTHQELLKIKGHYYNLYRNQFMKETIEKA